MLKIFDIMFDVPNMMAVFPPRRQKERVMRLAILPALAVLALAAPAAAQHAPAAAPASANLQGDDTAAWMADPHIHQFYDLSKATLGRGTDGVDVAAYEQKAYAIFRDFGASRGMPPEAMQDHLKLIPRQIVQIVKSDPHALDSYASFTEALVGPP
jgi:hypothetical protein